jgi:hypothetical protein
MNTLKTAQKILIYFVFILGIIVVVLLAKQQQDVRQHASQADLSAVGVCSSNNTIDINISFTNTTAATVNVSGRDSKTGKEIALGSVTPGNTVTGTIQTGEQTLDQDMVTFETSAGETKTATYTKLDCASTIRSCEIKEAQCTWDALDNTTQYNVTIIDRDTGAVVKSGVINHPSTSFTFPAEPAKKYTCEVIPLNSCGNGEKVSAEGSCPAPTPTTMPSSAPSPSDITSPTTQPTTIVPTPMPTQACFTREQVSSDSRCLFIINNKVYQKGTRAAPHQGHPCGTDVSSIVPSSHTSSLATYLTPNYAGNICSASASPTVTATTTQQPTSTPVPATVTTGTSAPTSIATVNRTGTNPTPTSIDKLPSTGFSQDVIVITMIGSAIAVMGAFVIIFLW